MRAFEFLRKTPTDKIVSSIKKMIPNWPHLKITKGEYSNSVEIGTAPAGGEGYYDPDQTESGVYFRVPKDKTAKIIVFDIGLYGDFAKKGLASKVIDILVSCWPAGIEVDTDASDGFWQKMVAKHGNNVVISNSA